MAGKIKSGLELSKQSWAVLRQNKQLLFFPIFSGLGMLAVTVLFLVPEGFIFAGIDDSAEPSTIQWVAAAVVLFLWYLVAYILVIFSNTALIGATLKLIKGEPATVGDGLSIAYSKFGKIVVWALISATIGVLARSISQSGRQSNNFIVAIVAAIIGGLIQGAWSVVVFFAIPVMVVEDLGVKDSLFRSWDLFKQTWGEKFTGRTAIGGISCLAYLAVFLVGGALIAIGVAANISALIIVGVVVALFGAMTIGLLSGAVNSIFQASLYNYAVSGDAGPFIDTKLAEGAFQE